MKKDKGDNKIEQFLFEATIIMSTLFLLGIIYILVFFE